MKTESKIIKAVGNYLDALGAKERKNDRCTVCAFFAYQPMRPQKQSDLRADGKGE